MLGLCLVRPWRILDFIVMINNWRIGHRPWCISSAWGGRKWIHARAWFTSRNKAREGARSTGAKPCNLAGYRVLWVRERWREVRNNPDIEVQPRLSGSLIGRTNVAWIHPRVLLTVGHHIVSTSEHTLNLDASFHRPAGIITQTKFRSFRSRSYIISQIVLTVLCFSLSS